jgi:hypothetical protein
MRKTLGFALLSCSLCILAWADARPQLARKTLDQPTEIQGIPCAKGYAWFYPDGHLDRCFVAREIAFGEAQIPAGSEIALTPDGKPKFVQMSHDTVIRGYVCAGGGWLGVAAGPTASFYPSGTLKECFLAANQTIQGVPCSQGGFWITVFGGDPSLKFRSDGRLASCKLTRDYGTQRKGDRFVNAP